MTLSIEHMNIHSKKSILKKKYLSILMYVSVIKLVIQKYQYFQLMILSV